MTLLAEKWPFWVTFLNNVKFWSLFYFEVAFRTFLVAFGLLLGLMSLLHKKEGPLKLSKNPKSTFYSIWSVFGGISNLLPISADYSLKSQIGISKNWVAPPPPPPKWAINLPFTSLRLLSQCISGHAPLNYFLSKIDPSVSPLCQFCGLEEETNVHFICKCPHFDRVRLKTTGMIHLSILSLQKIDISKIMAYILNSDRFCF